MKKFDTLTFDEWWELDQTKGKNYMNFRRSSHLGEYVLSVTSSRSIGRDRVDYIIEVRPNRYLREDEKPIFKDLTIYDPNEDENEKLLRKWYDSNYDSIESLREWYDSNMEEAQEAIEGYFVDKYFKKNRFDPEAESKFSYFDISKIISVPEVEEWLRAKKKKEKVVDFPNSNFLKKLNTPFLEEWLRKKKMIESPKAKDLKSFKTPSFNKFMADNDFYPCPTLGDPQLYLIELYSTLGDFELYILEVPSTKENCKSFEITMGPIRTNCDKKDPNDLLYYNKITDLNLFTKEGRNELEKWYNTETEKTRNIFQNRILKEYFESAELSQITQNFPFEQAQPQTAQNFPPEQELSL